MIRNRFLVGAVALSLAVAVGQAQAQQRPGAGGFGAFGGGDQFTALLRNEAVRKDLEMQPEQIQKIEAILREGRGERPTGDFRNLTDEQRAERREQATARGAETRAKIEKALLPHQAKRVEEIRIQQMGSRALTDEKVAGKLNLTDSQKAEITAALRGSREGLRELLQGTDREAAAAKLRELREESDKKALAVLSDAQKKQFEELQGEKIDLPRPTFGRGGAAGAAGAGRPGQRGAGAPGGRTRPEGAQPRGERRRPAPDAE